MAGIVTLTTDFGLRDAYVAEMKGVMLGIAHAARQTLQLVDVTHEIERRHCGEPEQCTGTIAHKIDVVGDA